MDGPTFYLQWNIQNWITVVIMAAVGLLAVGAVSAAVKSYRQMSAS
jgi:hypothetical protein